MCDLLEAILENRDDICTASMRDTGKTCTYDLVLRLTPDVSTANFVDIMALEMMDERRKPSLKCIFLIIEVVGLLF